MQNEPYRLIKVMCHRLPYELSNQLYQEFDFRFKEATYLIDNFSYYSGLKRYRNFKNVKRNLFGDILGRKNTVYRFQVKRS
jgi:hypothetical protein